MTLSPSSAAAERVFSLLKILFNPQQGSVLADALETAVMLRYNENNKEVTGDHQHGEVNAHDLAQNLLREAPHILLLFSSLSLSLPFFSGLTLRISKSNG